MGFPNLKHKIVVTNKTKGKSIAFSMPFRVTGIEGRTFDVPLESVEGDLFDLFDIQVEVYMLPPGQMDPVIFIKAELMHYEQILRNRPVTTAKKSSSAGQTESIKQEKHSILSVEECNDKHVGMIVRLHTDTYLHLLADSIRKLHYKIEVMNITQEKMVSFSATCDRSWDRKFNISLDRIPGCPSDDFDVTVTVYDGDNQSYHIMSASLSSYQKLLRYKDSGKFLSCLCK